MDWIGLYGAFLLLLLLFNIGASQAIIKTLPGYSGTLPFKLETGYIDVGENNGVQLFYYFIESENSPKKDPLLLWISGGPGCSGLFGIVYDIGPYTFDIENFDGSLPSILLNPYSWTKVANIIFIDAPIGTGFSYANTSQGYSSSDIKSTKDIYTFLRKWLLNHPTFIKNRLYVAGESYGGKLTPMVSVEILRGNEARLQPQMSFQGYIIGNGLTDPNIDFNARIPYAHRWARKPYDFGWDQTFRGDHSIDHLVLPNAEQECQNIFAISDYWANDPIVQEALNIRKGTITKWRTCYDGISFEPNVESALEYHKILIKKGYNVLVYK
ncbi:unnamed protein product [Fraxinus pennsylvanica]|uniref:Carboxypeptidase n=1 Tax=Fraxinus pennsylvanica TaxID=56036 RepID=A0AAD1YWS1_9LAMI|nr:unnamed protein product [Fraxinus pennsylvanica]